MAINANISHNRKKVSIHFAAFRITTPSHCIHVSIVFRFFFYCANRNVDTIFRSLLVHLFFS